MPDDDLLHSIVNGSPDFQMQYKDLMHGFSGTDANAPGGLHETLQTILGHLENHSAILGQLQAKPKAVQVVRDAGGRMVGAKVIP
jgi:hypothetical protein